MLFFSLCSGLDINHSVLLNGNERASVFFIFYIFVWSFVSCGILLGT